MRWQNPKILLNNPTNSRNFLTNTFFEAWRGGGVVPSALPLATPQLTLLKTLLHLFHNHPVLSCILSYVKIAYILIIYEQIKPQILEKLKTASLSLFFLVFIKMSVDRKQGSAIS